MASSIFEGCAIDLSFSETEFTSAADGLAQFVLDEAQFVPATDVSQSESLPSVFRHPLSCSDWSLRLSHVSLTPTSDQSTAGRRRVTVDDYIAQRTNKLGTLGSHDSERPSFDMSIASPSSGTPVPYYRHGNTSSDSHLERTLTKQSINESAGGDWSAFERTLTPLNSEGLRDSFFSLMPQNCRKESSKQDGRLSCVSDIQKGHFCLSVEMPQQISTSLEHTENGRSPLFEMSMSPDIIVINDADGDAGLKPHPGGSQLSANSSFDTDSVTLADAQTLKNVSRHTVGSRQLISGQHVKDLLRGSQTKDAFIINKPASGKENVRPSGSQSKKQLNSARQPVDLLDSTVTTHSTASEHRRARNQELCNVHQWRSPLRLSVNSAKNERSAESELFSRDSRVEHAASDTHDAFLSLSVASNDSSDSYVDQHSPGKLSERGVNTNSDEVYNRSSSTPVKDKFMQEPIRFRRQQHRSSSDEAGEEQRKSSLQCFGETSVAAGEVAELVIQLNKQPSATHATQRSVTRSGDKRAEANVDLAEPLSLSTASLPDDSLIIGDTSYESTVLLPLPAHVTAESVPSSHDTSCSEVATQTSLLLHSNDRKTNTPLTSGEKVVPGSANMSVIAPTELRIDSVCCVGLSAHGTLLLHNPSTQWLRVRLSVAQININGQPADHNISPFVVRPKVTVDPNSTESVKVVDSLWITKHVAIQ